MLMSELDVVSSSTVFCWFECVQCLARVQCDLLDSRVAPLLFDEVHGLWHVLSGDGGGSSVSQVLLKDLGNEGEGVECTYTQYIQRGRTRVISTEWTLVFLTHSEMTWMRNLSRATALMLIS